MLFVAAGRSPRQSRRRRHQPVAPSRQPRRLSGPRGAQRRVLAAAVASAPPVAVASRPGTSITPPEASAPSTPKRGDTRRRFPCAMCNSMGHWTRLRPSLSDSVRAQMARMRAQRLPARPSCRPSGVAAVVRTTPAGAEAGASCGSAKEESLLWEYYSDSGPVCGKRVEGGIPMDHLTVALDPEGPRKILRRPNTRKI